MRDWKRRLRNILVSDSSFHNHSQLVQYLGQLLRSAVDLAKEWRQDKYLRKLNAVMIVADEKVTIHSLLQTSFEFWSCQVSLMLTGDGDVIEPEGGNVLAIGSGGIMAHAAARALVDVDSMVDAEEIALRAMKIAASMCVFTNSNFTIETLSK